ncbi:hypothetical protein [uncultured Flavobacterium sp.]|uniref:hypothetical protein n=1 Tax=uncultured Flavobacterium sp. TaxID=165435 RepID=UPI0030C8794E
MKKIFFVALLLTSQLNFCQENNDVKKVSFENYFRFNFILPIQTGNHSLAKDFEPKIGFNTNLSLVSYNNFSLVFGYQFSRYHVINSSNVGDINRLNYSVIYGEIDYDIVVYDKLKVIPNIGYGYVNNKYKSAKRNFGSQEGTEFRLGTSINYNFTKTFSTFIGFNYVLTDLNINTNKAYEDYFGKASRFQINLGVKFE